MRGLGHWLLLSWVVVGGACTDASPSEGLTAASPRVQRGSFAAVDGIQLSAELLVQAKDSPSMESARAVVHDALLAQEAQRRLEHQASAVRRSVLARALLERLGREALAQEPITQEQRRAVAKRLWQVLDRPRALRTIEVFVPVPPMASGEEEYRVMKRLRDAATSAENLDQFSSRAREIVGDRQGFEYFRTPPLTADGRIVVETAADAQAERPPAEYLDAVGQLREIGDVSEVVASPNGFHLALVTDVLPAVSATEDERRRVVDAAIAELRGRQVLQELQERLRKQTPVEISNKQSTLTSLVWQER